MFIIIELTYEQSHVNIQGSEMVSSTNLSYYTYFIIMKSAKPSMEECMDIEKIFSLMDKAEKSSFSKIEIQVDDMKISLERHAGSPAVAAPIFGHPAQQAPVINTGCNEDEQLIDDLLIAPISGVFYVAKEPGAEPFVKEGQQVRKGETVCIIEAMKMMNEICAPKSGVIERVLVADSEAITAGDALFVYAKES